MVRKSFKAAVRQEPIEFDLTDDVVIHCRPRLSAGAIMRFVDGTLTDDDETSSTKKLLGTVMSFFKDAVLPPDWELFEKTIDDPDIPIDIGTLADIAGWLSGLYTARPTGPSSGDTSSETESGPTSTDGANPVVSIYSRSTLEEASI